METKMLDPAVCLTARADLRNLSSITGSMGAFMVRIGACAVLAAALAAAAPALAQQTPFSVLEASCRIGNDLAPECRMNVQGAFAEQNQTTPDQVTCDAAALWQARDAMGADFAEKPYYEALLDLVSRPGVCTIGASLTEPACSTGSPDPISIRSWTATPAPEQGKDAVRIDYVLTNNLDVDVLDFRANAIFRQAGQERLSHALRSDVAPPFPAGGEVTGSAVAMGDVSYLLDSATSLTVTACTTVIVQVDESVVEY